MARETIPCAPPPPSYRPTCTPAGAEGSGHVCLSKCSPGSWWLPLLPSNHLPAPGIPSDVAATRDTQGPQTKEGSTTDVQTVAGGRKSNQLAVWTDQGTPVPTSHWDVPYLPGRWKGLSEEIRGRGGQCPPRAHLEWNWLAVEREVCEERSQVHSQHENSEVSLLAGLNG